LKMARIGFIAIPCNVNGLSCDFITFSQYWCKPHYLFMITVDMIDVMFKATGLKPRLTSV
jgi:hypothetical protein